MDNIRRRVPFKVVEDENIQEENVVLDEQQQEAVIDDLRKENDNLTQSHHLALGILVGLSTALQLIEIRRNPLLAVYPVTSQDPSLPLPAMFSLLSLFIHLNFALFLFQNELRVLLHLDNPPRPLSFRMLYCISAISPTLSLLLNKPWQTTTWWCITSFMVFIVETVLEAIRSNKEGIAGLETLRYGAPGA